MDRNRIKQFLKMQKEVIAALDDIVDHEANAELNYDKDLAPLCDYYETIEKATDIALGLIDRIEKYEKDEEKSTDKKAQIEPVEKPEIVEEPEDVEITDEVEPKKTESEFKYSFI